jgi:hypothetical protein
MASVISADKSFAQAITIALRGDESFRFQTAQARLANAGDDLGYTERAVAETTVSPLPIASYGKNRLLAAGSSERAQYLLWVNVTARRSMA